MIKQFFLKGHHYKVVAVEGSTDYLITKDGSQTIRVNQSVAMNAVKNVETLFKEKGGGDE